MESAIVHFQNLTPSELIQNLAHLGAIPVLQDRWTVQEGNQYFFVDRYSEKDIREEYEATRLEQLISQLHGFPSCSIAVSAAHCSGARRALEFILRLTVGVTAIIDDDHGGFWSIADIRAHFISHESASILTLSELNDKPR